MELIATHFKAEKEPKKDLNANEVSNGVDGAGDRSENQKAEMSSSTESEDEEFEEAAEDN